MTGQAEQQAGQEAGQEAAVRRLVADGVITDEQADAVLAALRVARVAGGRRTGWWVEALGYVGGGLLLAGAVTLVGVSWNDISRAGKVVLLAAVTLLLAVAGLLVARGPAGLRRLREGSDPVRRRVVGVLFALAAGGAGLTAQVAWDDSPEVVPAATALAVALAGYAAVRTVPGLLAAVGFSVPTVAIGIDEVTFETLPMAIGFVVLGGLWAAAALAGLAVPRPLGAGLGAGIALIGAQLPVGSDDIAGWGYALTFAIAVACLVAYRWQQVLVLLVAGVVGVTLAAAEAMWDVTNGAGGGAIALMVAGVVLLAGSGMGLRLHRTRTPRPS